MSALELEQKAKIVDDLILRLGDLAIKVRSSAVLFHQKFRVSKTERTPVSARFAFYGDIESIEHVEGEDGRLILTIVLKQKTAP
jgi:hypothetical protein